jgi:tetratricopeptide (TPR) repeat protein
MRCALGRAGHRLLFVLLTFLAFASSASAAQLAVFPFVSSEPRLGFAVADRLAHAVASPSLPPELSLGLVPPYVLQNGRFISPLTLLGQGQTGSRYAAQLLREFLGVEVAVTGRVRYLEDELELELFIARPDGARALRFRAPETAPARLVAQARAALDLYTDLVLEPAAPMSLDLSSPYGTFIDGLMQLSSGFPEAALPLLEESARTAEAEPRYGQRAASLRRVLAERSPGSTPLLAAVVGLNLQPFEVAEIRRAFAASTLPLAQLWDGLLAVQAGQMGAAGRVFTALEDQDYPFAQVERILFALRDPGTMGRAALELETLLGSQSESLAVHVGGLFVAQTLGDGVLEREVATRLTELAPAFAYPYERLSHLAFDRNDALAAATALKTASRLEPGSSLYWTNLGWSYYLLGVLDKSEQASRRATELDGNEFIARYNLGLVQVVKGRLETALATYDEAVARDLLGDNSLDPAAIDDLLGALQRYPDVPEIDYALATLYEVTGELNAAEAAYTRYAERGRGELRERAQARAETLRAPPPPLTISPGARLGVGPDALRVPAYTPGDILYPQFELGTPAEEIPTPFEVELRLRDASGQELATMTSTERTPLPPQTVAVEITNAALELPEGLAAGRYRLELHVRARGRMVSAALPLRVAAGQVPLVRQLIGRGIVLREVTSGQPLYTEADAREPMPTDEAFVAALRAELASSASTAAETLPVVRRGRFAGQSGEVLFGSSKPEDIRDFLTFLLGAGAGTDASFADLYANWALDGAPAP